jgi:hypothetical protein
LSELEKEYRYVQYIISSLIKVGFETGINNEDRMAGLLRQYSGGVLYEMFKKDATLSDKQKE